ncbi:MAG TPA: VOC family protein [Ignavibacteria bacterium]|nr:VOC family protein [Ignavibacteria bacterium]
MAIKINRIDHIQLAIPKESESIARKFYTGVLGLTEIEKPESLKASGGVWYKAGDVELHLGVEDNFVPGKKKAHPAFVVEGLNRIKVQLIQNDIEIKEEIQIPERKRFSFYDPFGNRIEFMEFEG